MPSHMCMTARQIRDMLLEQENPDIWATRWSAADVTDQGICCGPGYEVNAYNEFGQLGVIGPTRILGKYRWFEPGPGDDVTFTQRQWIRFSHAEAWRCLRSL